MTGNEYQNLAARTINKKLILIEKELHALHLWLPMKAHVGAAGD